MNQILVTKKLYVTPELKRKKKIYKFDFILSIFLVIVLISVGIYAEYDRSKSEEVSQDILEDYLLSSEQSYEDNKNDTTIAKDDSVLLIVLDEDDNRYGNETKAEEENSQPQETVNNTSSEKNNTQAGSTTSTQATVKKTAEGYKYTTIATINIPKINVNYPILEGETGGVEETDALLKISPCKFWGPNVNEVGNFCIVGHNWRNSKFFSKVPTLVVGDTFTITEPYSRTVTYEIYDKYTVEPSNLGCTSQLTGGKKEVTLITCTDNGERRIIVKAREVK
ncbi:MAG: sortase [Clostridia bacterium]|nr:sortase [Clostridia bacterium]